MFGNNRSSNPRNVEIDTAPPIGPESMDSSYERHVDKPAEPVPSNYSQAQDISQDMMDTSETAIASVVPSESLAGNALAEPVTIRIGNQNGVYFESTYFRNIGFISRYEITAEFADFIENYIK